MLPKVNIGLYGRTVGDNGLLALAPAEGLWALLGSYYNNIYIWESDLSNVLICLLLITVFEFLEL